MNKKRILVIEDNFEVRDNLSEILELAGYDVLAAENGKIGAEKAITEIPDLIICDVMMPMLDGFGVLKILNANPKTNHIPLIFLTAKAEKTDFRKGMGLGAEDYITKPFEDTDLLDAIEIRLKKAARINTDFDGTEPGLQRFFSEAKANEEFEKLSLDKELRNYTAKDIIYEEGNNPRWLYFIVSGKVRIFQTNEYGKELNTKLLAPGEFFGYFSLIHDTPYTNGASCIDDTILRLIPKADFSLLLFNNKNFAAQFIKIIANRTEETEKQLIDMAYSSVRKKVANALIAFAKTQTDSNNGKTNINCSREELAITAGTAKETLIRTLSDFKAEQLIEVNARQIVILDIQELKDIIA